LAAWIKWRGYQAATPVPGAVTAYRTVRKIVRPQVLVNNNDNRPKRAPVALRVKEPSGTGILFIVPWLQVGGADKVNLDLLRKLDRRKYHPVLLTTLGRDHPQLREFQKCCDDIFHLASFPASAEEHLDLISHLIATRNVAIVQISNSERGYQLLPHVKSLADVKVLSLVHSDDPLAKRDFIDIAVASDEWVDRHVAVSERVASMLRGRGVSGDKVLAIANGVDTALFAPGQSRWLSDRGSRATTVITFVGRLVEQKDPLLFVAAVEELLWRQRLDDVAVIVVGDGPLREVVRAKLGALRQTCEVFLLGACSEVEVAEILKCTTVLVVPSLFEGLPIIGLEAMASAVPIVATRVSGWQELLRDGVTGRLVERDAVRIADATAELLRDRDKAGAMGERARAVVVRDYSVDDMAKAYEELWAQLLSERSAEGRHDRKGAGEPLVGGANRSIS
jgi:glycosyltransferase involved in cell wall biosynthesis